VDGWSGLHPFGMARGGGTGAAPVILRDNINVAYDFPALARASQVIWMIII